jgi:hypothetical protein
LKDATVAQQKTSKEEMKRAGKTGKRLQMGGKLTAKVSGVEGVAIPGHYVDEQPRNQTITSFSEGIETDEVEHTSDGHLGDSHPNGMSLAGGSREAWLLILMLRLCMKMRGRQTFLARMSCHYAEPRRTSAP